MPRTQSQKRSDRRRNRKAPPPGSHYAHRAATLPTWSVYAQEGKKRVHRGDFNAKNEAAAIQAAIDQGACNPNEKHTAEPAGT